MKSAPFTLPGPSADVAGNYFEDDDGHRYYGEEGRRRGDEHWAAVEENNRQYVERLTLDQRAELERVLLERSKPDPADVERVRRRYRLHRASKSATTSVIAAEPRRTGERDRDPGRGPRRSGPAPAAVTAATTVPGNPLEVVGSPAAPRSTSGPPSVRPRLTGLTTN